MKKNWDKIKIDKTVLSLWIGMVLFGILAEIVGLVLTQEKLVFSIGLWCGIFLQFGITWMMKRDCERAVEMGAEQAEKYIRFRSFLRSLFWFLVMAVAININVISCIGVFFGLFSLKVAALLSPVVFRYFISDGSE